MIAQACHLSVSRSPAHAPDGQFWRGLLVLLLFVFVFDLMSSPFHAHHHAGGPEGYASHLADDSHFASAAVTEQENDSLHSEAADHSGGHGMSAVQSASTPLFKSESVAKAFALVPLFVFFGLLTHPTAERLVRWRPGRQSVLIPLFRTVPPDGRAPPSLHA